MYSVLSFHPFKVKSMLCHQYDKQKRKLRYFKVISIAQLGYLNYGPAFFNGPNFQDHPVGKLLIKL